MLVVAAVADAADVVSQKLAHQVHLAQMEMMVKMVLQVKPETTVKMAQLLLLNLKLIGASNVLMLKLVHPALLVLKVHPVMLALQVKMLMVVLVVLPVLLVSILLISNYSFELFFFES